jgi:hypothetical protein
MRDPNFRRVKNFKGRGEEREREKETLEKKEIRPTSLLIINKN